MIKDRRNMLKKSDKIFLLISLLILGLIPIPIQTTLAHNLM